MNRAQHLEILCDTGPFPESSAAECAAVTVGGRATRDAVRAYANTAVCVQTLIDWPSGLGKPTVRQIEAVAAAKDGTHGVQVSVHPAHVMNRDDAGLREDVMGLVIAVREVSRHIAVDVAIDAAWLSDEPGYVEAVCRAVQESGGDGVVVSVGPQDDPQQRAKAAAVCGASGPLSAKVLVPSASEDAWRQWIERGADRVVVPSGILFG